MMLTSYPITENAACLSESMETAPRRRGCFHCSAQAGPLFEPAMSYVAWVLQVDSYHGQMRGIGCPAQFSQPIGSARKHTDALGEWILCVLGVAYIRSACPKARTCRCYGRTLI